MSSDEFWPLYTGDHYVLGGSNDSLLIWRRGEAPTSPAHRFADDDAGRSEALRMFYLLEPNAEQIMNREEAESLSSLPGTRPPGSRPGDSPRPFSIFEDGPPVHPNLSDQDVVHGVAEVSDDPWWFGLGRDRPSSLDRCPDPGCAEVLDAAAIHCPRHSKLLILQGGGKSRARRLFIGALHFLAVGVVGISLRIDSPFPVYAGLAALVGLSIAARLRRYDVARTVALITLAVAAFTVAAVIVLDISTTGRKQLAGSGLILVGLAGAFMAIRGPARYLRESFEDGEEGIATGRSMSERARAWLRNVSQLPATLVAGALGVAPPMLLLSQVLPLFGDHALVQVAAKWLLIGGLSAGASALVVAASASFIRAYGAIDRNVVERWGPKDEAKERKLHEGSERELEALRASRSSGSTQTFIARLQFSVLRIRIQILKAASFIAHALTVVWIAVANLVIAFAERVRQAFVRLGRRIDRTARFTVHAFGVAGVILKDIGRRYARSTILTTVGAATAAVAAWWFAAEMITYLGGGPFAAAGRAFLAVGIAIVGGSLLWGGVSGLPWRSVVRHEVTSVTEFWPSAFVLLVGGGWLLGISGLLGWGPARPGPITLAGSAVFLIALYPRTFGSQKESAPNPATDPAPGGWTGRLVGSGGGNASAYGRVVTSPAIRPRQSVVTPQGVERRRPRWR